MHKAGTGEKTILSRQMPCGSPEVSGATGYQFGGCQRQMSDRSTLQLPLWAPSSRMFSTLPPMPDPGTKPQFAVGSIRDLLSEELNYLRLRR